MSKGDEPFGPSRRLVLGAKLGWLIAGNGFATLIQRSVETAHATIEPGGDSRLNVRLAAGERRVLVFTPARGAWDWSATSKLVMPVDNRGDAQLTLTMEVNSGAETLAGTATIAPKTAKNLTMWLAAPLPRAMGMVAGPSLAAAGVEPANLPVTATTGSLDTTHVKAVRLSVWRPLVPTRFIVGPLRVMAPSAEEKDAYIGIIDGFGQYRPGEWPEKVHSVAMLRGGRDEAPAARAPALRVRNRFGGLTGASLFRPTGFFRTERRNGRWWLVTPEGHAFFSIGIDVVAAPGATYVEGREFMFRDLPSRDGRLRAHWSVHDDRLGLGAQRGRRFDHGYAFDFYSANLERKFGTDWRRRWREDTLARLEHWGFNTIGNWSDPDLCAMHHLPYTVPLEPEARYGTVTSGADWWGPMPDPFDPKFADAVDSMARKAAARFVDDPYLIGYFVQNEPSWGAPSKDPRRRYSIAIGALAAAPESPAKVALVAQLARTYRTPEQLGQAWGMTLGSWSELRREGFVLSPASLDRPAVHSDLAVFTAAFADRYFRTVGEALRHHDPHHLYLGCRFAGWTAESLAAAAQWCDVVSFNVYQRSIADDADRWPQFHQLGKPALIGEFHFGSVDRGLFWEGIIGAGSESERGRAYAQYLNAVADNPDFVGAHWFQYADEPVAGRTLDGENGHIGFVSVADVPYQGLVAAAMTANARVLRRLDKLARRVRRPAD